VRPAIHPVATIAHPLATVGYPAATIVRPVAITNPLPHVVAPALVGSSSYQSVVNNGAAYTTGVNALHTVPVVVRGRREADANADADAEADAFYAVNGYTHQLPGHSYAAISTPSYVSPIAYPYYNYGLGYHGVYHG